ncbi:MAG: glycosyltransferase family 4 protein [Anaerolineae bacterium]
MKVLLLYEYPPPPAGLATQAHLLYRGLAELGVDVHAVHLESYFEKEWYYRWFHPDVAIGIGYWGHTPYIVTHPREHGILPVPWLVADGYLANYRAELNSLPLILTTSNWVKQVYVRDGLRDEAIEVLPVGCDTDVFRPHSRDEAPVAAVREEFGIRPDQLMLLTIGGDAASKGGQEVMRALAKLGDSVPDWVYACKVWPQPRTVEQDRQDLELARELGIEDKMRYAMCIASRDLMPYLLSACDIYAAPSRLEGFGMPQVEANACGRPVLSINAMGMLDTMVQGETAMLAAVGTTVRLEETVVGPEAGFEPGHKVVFGFPRVAGYRADVDDLAAKLRLLMTDPALRQRLGEAGRNRAVSHYDYRVVARRLVTMLSDRLGLS